MPAVTTDAGMETNTMESSVNTTTRETAGKAPATESTMMKVVMMKEPEAEPYRYAVGVIRQ